MRLMPRTIMGQLVAGTLVVQLLVFGVFLVFSVRRDFRAQERHDRVRLEKQTSIIAGLVAEPLAKNDSDLMDHVVHAVPIAASVKGARITDVQGKTLRLTSDQIPMELTPQEQALLPKLEKDVRYQVLALKNGDTEGVQPVLADGLVRGIVWVTQDQVLATSAPTSVLQRLSMYFPLALIGNLLLVWGLSESMARPLGRLGRAAQHVQLDPNDLSAFPLPITVNNEAGELTGSVNAMVSEIAQQRRGLQDTLNLLDSLLTGAPIGFGFYDREYRYVRLNEQLASLHGIPVEAHIGKRLRDLMPAGADTSVANQTEELVEIVFNTGEAIPEGEIIGVLPGEESERAWQVSYFPVKAGEDAVRWVGVIATDITHRKKSEEAMRRSERLAAAGRLATSIAHEINNPLESITNLLYLLRHQGSLDAQAVEYAAQAQKELQRVGEITQQTLRFYKQSNTAVDVRVAEALRSVILLHNARLKSPRIEVDTRLDDKIVMFGFAGELRQVFASLVGNAIDAMPNGGVLYIRAHYDRCDGAPGVRVTIADTGIGMPEGVLKRIFEPFFTTKQNTGTGLGLWVSEEILNKHKAVVQVRSREAHYPGDISGTVFRIFFPQRGVQRKPFIVHSSSQVLADHLV